MATIFPHPIYIAWSPADSEIIFRTWKKKKKNSVKSPFRGGLAVDLAATLTSLSQFLRNRNASLVLKNLFCTSAGHKRMGERRYLPGFSKPLVPKKYPSYLAVAHDTRNAPLENAFGKNPSIQYMWYLGGLGLRANHTHASAPFATVATHVGFVNRLQKVFLKVF